MTEQQQRPLRLMAITVLAISATLIGLLVSQYRGGIQVTIENTGATPVRTVVLHVTGASYQLGDIGPGESATARVNPISESHLDVEFTDRDGQPQRLHVDGYFEPGYRGTIRVEIKDGLINKFEDNTKHW